MIISYGPLVIMNSYKECIIKVYFYRGKIHFISTIGSFWFRTFIIITWSITKKIKQIVPFLQCDERGNGQMGGFRLKACNCTFIYIFHLIFFKECVFAGAYIYFAVFQGQIIFSPP